MRTTAERSVTHTATISTNKETETGSQELDFNARLKKPTFDIEPDLGPAAVGSLFF
jgi:hypothetical protein